MSNMNKDHPSIRVHAPPGGRSANIFGVPEPEQPVSTKKHHMQSDIFGCKSPSDAAPTKPTTRPMTNNIFGNDPEPVVPKTKVYSEKNRSTIFDEAPPSQPSNKPDRQRSNIFAASEPVTAAPTRPVADKFKSNIFGSGDDEQNKRQPGTRQGLRDGYRPSIAISLYSPLRKRTVGYNPINGEPYATKDNVQNKLESLEINEKKPEGDEGEVSNGQDSTEKSNNGHDTVTNGKNGQTATTSVRVVHPPGGRSNGPLW